MLTPSLSSEAVERACESLVAANLAHARRYPGEPSGRQPIHTVYGGAHLFRADLARKLGDAAIRALDEYAPDPDALASALGLSSELASTIRARVIDKLRREPVEDLRIDFEDGYGARPDAEEDEHAAAAAREMAKAMAAGALPPFIGIRIKALDEESRLRAVRTLDLFLTTLVAETGRKLPDNFVVTLPKVTVPEQITALDDLFHALERALGLEHGALKLELMIEAPQAIVAPTGEIALHALYERARDRCVAAHFGAYDYTASCNISAAHQDMKHPACDLARHLMQLAYAGTGLRLSDGATNVMPTPIHRRPAGGAPLTPEQLDDNRRAVHRAWRLSYEHIQHSLSQGFYQGWDLHPAQIPIRYAAVYAFFLSNLEPAAARLRNFVEKAARATMVGSVFDDAATGQGLLGFFLRAIGAGAITEDEAIALTTLSQDDLRGRSFLRILERRRA